jgi:hypothetical protein
MCTDDSIGQAPFYHGLLHVKIAGIHVLALHSSPENSLEREKESIAIGEITSGKTHSVFPNELVLVMGDFNNVSPIDKHLHDAHNVIGLMREVCGLLIARALL